MSHLTSFIQGLVVVAVAAALVTGPGPGALAASPAAPQVLRTPMVTGWPAGTLAANAELPPADKAVFEEAFKAVSARNWTRAQSLAADLRHPVARKFIAWTYLTDEDTKPRFEELVAFIEANSNWPSQETMLRKAEEAMPETMPPQQLIAWYAGQEPLTGEGKIRLGKALIATGKTEYGTSWLRRAFAEHDFSDTRQREIYTEHSALLDTPTIDKRLDTLLWSSQHTQAAWLLPYASPDARRIAEARIALMRNQSNALGIAAGLAADEREDAGVLFDEIRFLRRRGDDAAAQRIFTKVVKDRAVPYPEKWWIERNVQVRTALEIRDYATAYAIASNHGLSEGSAFSDAAFLAGWTALRFLKKPDAAYGHFAALEEGVSYPISLARARYWMGRAAEAMGDTEKARAAYRAAADLPYTFYGQLAAESALVANSKLELPLGDPVAADPAGAFFRNELVTAIRMLGEIEADRYLRSLAYHLADDEATTRDDLVLLAELMRRMDQEAIAVRVAKKASQRLILLTDYLYPVVSLPPYRGTGIAPEPAIVLGLSRQESEFNPRAVSSAGARGLMQLMPSTAKITARKHGLTYDAARLLSDPNYNMQIGMAHLGDLLDRFNGSYIMVFAGYNAGPGRVDQWVAELGDPRTGAIDPIDWIESIPFSETRNYVQRVLENVMVYRHRLAGEPVAYAVVADLKRNKRTPATAYAGMGLGLNVVQGTPKPAPASASPQPVPAAKSDVRPAIAEETVGQSAPVAAPPAAPTPVPATAQAHPDDYLPSNTPVVAEPAAMAPVAETGEVPAGPAPSARGASTAAETAAAESEAARPNASPLESPPAPPPEVNSGWKIPLDCTRFVILPDGTGECID